MQSTARQPHTTCSHTHTTTHTQPHTRSHTHTATHTQPHTQPHTCSHTHAATHTRSHTHTHTHSRPPCVHHHVEHIHALILWHVKDDNLVAAEGSQQAAACELLPPQHVVTHLYMYTSTSTPPPPHVHRHTRHAADSIHLTRMTAQVRNFTHTTSSAAGFDSMFSCDSFTSIRCPPRYFVLVCCSAVRLWMQR